jgi:hypothetical protein
MLTSTIYNESIKLLLDGIADLTAMIEELRYKNPDSPEINRLERIKNTMLYAMKANKDMEILCQDVVTYKAYNAMLIKVDRYRHTELNKYKTIEALMLSGQLEKVTKTVEAKQEHSTLEDEVPRDD